MPLNPIKPTTYVKLPEGILWCHIILAHHPWKGIPGIMIEPSQRLTSGVHIKIFGQDVWFVSHLVNLVKTW